MKKEEMDDDKIVRLCYKHLDKFTDIYVEDSNTGQLQRKNKMPSNVKLIVYCKGSEDEGFLINVTSNELGLEELIAQKWIIYSEFKSWN